MNGEERDLRPLSSYLEFGLRLHLEDFAQLTGGALLVYVPVSLILTMIMPPFPTFEEITQSTGGVMAVISRVVGALILLRVALNFVIILILLRVDARRSQGQSVWDFPAAFARLWPVALVDLSYVIGVHMAGLLIFMGSFLAAGGLVGKNFLTLPIAMTVTAFLILGPAIRYYFASYLMLFRGGGFAEVFQGSAAISSGGERLILSLVAVFLGIWFLLLAVVQRLFGAGFLGQILLQASMMTFYIPYFITSYLLFLDLASPEAKSSPAGGGELPDVADSPEADREEDSPRRDS